jgi:hypothetical protein
MSERRLWRGWRWLKYFLGISGYVDRRYPSEQQKST